MDKVYHTFSGVTRTVLTLRPFLLSLLTADEQWVIVDFWAYLSFCWSSDKCP
jgi:hypothetical protein